MKLNVKRCLIALVLSVAICIPAFSATADEVKGYYSSLDSTSCRPPVQAFINTVNANYKYGPYVGYPSRFDSSNDSYWDSMDMGIVCAHGNRWLFALSGGYVNFASSTFGSSSSKGWGNVDMEWAVLYSCLVVASPLEVTDWYSVWIDESNDVFDRLHIINGFRTSAWVYCSDEVTTDYAQRLNNGGKILDAFYDAIYAEGDFGNGWDRACSVYYDSCKNDTFSSIATDPSETSESGFKFIYIN
jgi:hypothetical protein